MKDEISDRWLSPQQAAERLGLCVRTIKRLMLAGRLPGVILGRKIVRIRESELNKFTQGK